MKAIYEELKSLQNKYPTWVNLFPPANPDNIIATERILEIDIDSKLKELYQFTNGFGIVDYCCLGVGNKKIANLLSQYPLDRKDGLNSKIITFMATSCGEDFAYFENTDSAYHRIYLIDRNIEGKAILIANNLEDFFIKFIYKIKILLSVIEDNDIIMYFDDEKLPDGLAMW